MFHLISKKQAKEIGLKFFFTGKPCKPYGNYWLRSVSRDKCECKEHREHRNKLSRERETDESRAIKCQKAKDYIKNNREKYLESKERHKLKMKNMGVKRQVSDEQKERIKKDRLARPYYYSYLQSRTKIRKRYPDAIANYSELDEFTIMQAHELAYLRNGYWHVDHLIPLAKGGSHSWDNVQVIPKIINIMKRDRLIFTKPHQWFNYA